MTKFTNFFKVIACFTCLTIQMNMVSAQWPPIGIVGNGTVNDPWQITTITQLTNLATYVNAGNGSLIAGKYYKLMNDIDYNSSGMINNAKGWSPIGNNEITGAIFQGNFDGNGKKVYNIRINRDTTSYIGLFGYVSSAHIHNLGVRVYQEIIGNKYVGGLIGRADNSTIDSCYAIGNITGNYAVGGLVGVSNSSTIHDSYTICDVRGYILYGGDNSTVGGLVGMNDGIIRTSYASGNVTAKGKEAGGFAGTNNNTIIDCYAVGNVIGHDSYMGGFAGANKDDGNLSYCYATGDIKALGGDYIGGLVGVNTKGPLINCIAANNSVSGGVSNVNRVVGVNKGTLSNNYAFAGMAITPNGGDPGTNETMTTLKSFNFYNTGNN